MKLCPELESRLNSVWFRLQQLEIERPNHSRSQIDVDTRCVERLERFVTELEECSDLVDLG